MLRKRTSESAILVDSVLGKTEEEAKLLASSSGFSTRVVQRDDEKFVVTMDLRFDRLNLYIENNIVIKSNIG